MGNTINTAAVVLGALLGLILNRRVNKALLDNIMKAVGVSVMFIGISGALTGMLKIQNGKIDSTGAMLLIISLVLGTLIGELIKIEDRLESIGEKLKKAVNKAVFFLKGINIPIIKIVFALQFIAVICKKGMNIFF